MERRLLRAVCPHNGLPWDRYTLGLGVPQDNKKALEWFQSAAERGNADAQVALGRIYGNGEDDPKNFRKARE